MDIKGGVDSHTVIVGYFNTPLTSMERSSRQQINKEMVVLNDPIDQMDLMDIFRALHSREEKYTFLSSTYETFEDRLHVKTQKTEQ